MADEAVDSARQVSVKFSPFSATLVLGSSVMKGLGKSSVKYKTERLELTRLPNVQRATHDKMLHTTREVASRHLMNRRPNQRFRMAAFDTDVI